MSATIHIAGFPVRVGNQCRQRCAWCGQMISEMDLEATMVALNEDGTVPDAWTPFEPNVLVSVEKSGGWTSTRLVEHQDGAPIPAGWCGDEGKPRIRAVPDVPGGE